MKFDLRHRARLVAGGNWTSPDDSESYSTVVSNDNLKLTFFIAELNNLQVIATDIGKAYLHGTTREKVFIMAGPEFGELKGHYLIIVKSLYGLKTSGARWHEKLSETLRQAGFSPSFCDSDIWIRPNKNLSDYIVVYVDDILVISRDAKTILSSIAKIYPIKGHSFPSYHLGGDIHRIKGPYTDHGYTTILSSKTYIKNICDKIEKTCMLNLRSYGSPMDPIYHPELDTSDFILQSDTTKYRMMIGCGLWAITLGRFDIHYAISTLSQLSLIHI